jgi:hypothetical protein
MAIVHAPAPARYGFRVVAGGHVIPVHDLAAAAREMVRARGTGKAFDVSARVTLTAERPLTAAECGALIDAAAARLKDSPAVL